MAKVNIINKNVSVDVKEGTSLVYAIRKMTSFETPCNQRGLCGKCNVKATGYLSDILEIEKEYIKQGERLACCAKVLGDAYIELLEEESEMKSKTEGKTRDVSIKNKYEKENSFGVSVDLGTTGISAYLVDLKSGKILSKSSNVNPQTEYGGDVLSRVSFSTSIPDGCIVLKDSIVKGINNLINSLIENSVRKVKNEDIYKVTVSGNTIMLHMLFGISARGLSVSPYTPEFTCCLYLSKDVIDFNVNKKAEVILLPSVSAYVGADIVSGIINCEIHKKQSKTLFIDIGTNGEIALSINGKIYATAAAAGPAFEGMNIECGSRAVKGAIDSFEILDDVKYTTIENSPAKSVCGSGIIDIASEMVKNKIILKTGRINKKLSSLKSINIYDKKVEITKDVYVTQEDIRNIQLAKGAISCGVKMLLKECNEKIENIDEFIIAGSFGYHLREESLRTLGIIPSGFSGKVSFVGNVSLEGARLSLINDNILEEMNGIKDEIVPIELSHRDDFQKEFIGELRF